MKKKVLILIILFLIPLLFLKINVKAEETGVINDPGTTGLWHELEKEENDYYAYVWMRWYYSATPNLTQTNFKDNHIPHSIFLSSWVRFDYANPNDVPGYVYMTERTLSAPNGFNTFYIKTIDNSGKFHNVYVGNTRKIKIVLICDKTLDYGFDMIVYNAESNQELFKHEVNDFQFIMYWHAKNVEVPINVIDVKDNYDQLPLLNKQFIKISKYELLDANSNSYKLYFENNLKIYAFDISFPSFVNIKDYEISKDDINISYSTFKEKKFLYLQPDKTKKPYAIRYGTVEKPADLFVGFITIYLDKDNPTYDIVKKLDAKIIVNKEKMASAYAYLTFDIPVEDVLNIHFKFKYRYKFFGFAGKWNEVYRVYAKEDKSEVNPLWWMYFYSIYGLVGAIFDAADVLNKDTIVPISYSNIPQTVKDRYINILKADVNKLTNGSHYKVHLGQFDAFGSTNYDISEIEMVEITYKYQGIIYNVPYDLIDQDVDNPGITPVFNEFNFTEFFKFAGVKDFGSFLSHLVKFWKESIIIIVIFIVFLYITLIIIKMISSIISPLKYKYRRYYR